MILKKQKKSYLKNNYLTMPKKSPVLVTISTFVNVSEAQKAKKLLALNAILSYIENNIKEGVKGKPDAKLELKVSSSDYDLAYIVLSEHIEKSNKNNQGSTIDFNSIFVCPSCGQINTNNRVKSVKSNLIASFISILRIKESKITCDFCIMKFSKSELIKKD